MGAVEMDRQAIERRDFPIVRRGYDPASVDAHLRALAAEVEELRRQAVGAGRETLAAVAGTQVQAILEAAQASAQAIESEAAERAAQVREEADAVAHATREQAIATAQERVASVTQATEALLQRVGSLDGEARTLVDSMRGGAGRLVDDLEALSAEMAGLYDAAAGHQAGAGEQVAPIGEAQQPVFAPTGLTTEAPPIPAGGIGGAAVPASEIEADPLERDTPAAVGAEDLDGARLVALNMALNGDTREATGRYLAENFHVSDAETLLNEVYSAIEA